MPYKCTIIRSIIRLDRIKAQTQRKLIFVRPKPHFYEYELITFRSINKINWLHKNRGTHTHTHTHSIVHVWALRRTSNLKSNRPTSATQIVRAILFSSWCKCETFFPINIKYLYIFIYMHILCWSPKTVYNELLTNRFLVSVVNLIVVYCKKKRREQEKKQILSIIIYENTYVNVHVLNWVFI